MTENRSKLFCNRAEADLVASLISKLSPAMQRELLADLNYLNLGEIKTFCRQHGIPYAIWIETADGRRVKMREDDRKGVILERIRVYLKTGRIPDATCFSASVVCFDEPPKNLKASDRLLYGHYDPQRTGMIELLTKLSGGKFRHGALARILAREFWSKGVAPTYAEFASAWLDVQANHTRPNPEWAFLSDRSDGKETADWRRLRTSKAKRVLRIINQVTHK
jgi:hypothetical protein